MQTLGRGMEHKFANMKVCEMCEYVREMNWNVSESAATDAHTHAFVFLSARLYLCA